MRKMVHAAFAAALLLGSGALLLTCDLFGESEDKGGAGADFDASQYYTKAQVDQLLQARPRMFHANAASAATITGMGFNNHSTTWNPPSGCSAVVMMITVKNTSAETRTLKLGISRVDDAGAPSIRISVPANGWFEMPVFWRYFDEVAVPGSIKLWLMEGTAADMEISGLPFYWFSGAGGL